MIKIVETPPDFEFPYGSLMWLEPVELPSGLPNDMAQGQVAYDLLSDDIDGSYFYVGLGDGTACRVKQLPIMSKSFCPHCGGDLR